MRKQLELILVDISMFIEYENRNDDEMFDFILQIRDEIDLCKYYQGFEND